MNASDSGRRDWRATIQRLRAESNDALRELWAGSRAGLDEREGDEPTGEAEREPERP